MRRIPSPSGGSTARVKVKVRRWVRRGAAQVGGQKSRSGPVRGTVGNQMCLTDKALSAVSRVTVQSDNPCKTCRDIAELGRMVSAVVQEVGGRLVGAPRRKVIRHARTSKYKRPGRGRRCFDARM